MTQFLQVLANAVSTGGLYALVAIGLALIFGVMGLINFAYGEIVIATIYAAYILNGQPSWVVMLGMLVAGVAISVVVERLAFRPLRNASPLTMLIAAFAVSFILKNLAYSTLGASPRSVTAGSALAFSQHIGPIQVPAYSIVTIFAVIVIVVILRLFLSKTALGIGMRAASEDFDAARLLGVKANSVIRIAFILSGAIAAVVGYLMSSAIGSVTPQSGTHIALVGFIAIVVGGMGSMAAAALGGFLLGVISVLLQYALPNNVADFRDAIFFFGVLLLLVFRPQGLFIRRSSIQKRV